jgi:hypothetical protein
MAAFGIGGLHAVGIGEGNGAGNSNLSSVFHKFGDVFYPTPTLTLPLKGREITAFLPLQGGGQEGDGISVGVIRNGIVFMKRTT